MTTPGPKLDTPFTSDQEILDLVAQFEARTWPYERWTHRAHLAVAYIYLRRLSFPDALARIRQNIQSYTRPYNPTGYHETITVFFLLLIADYLRRADGATPQHATVNRLFELCDMKALAAYYSSERLGSAKARANWVEPDLKPLPFRVNLHAVEPAPHV